MRSSNDAVGGTHTLSTEPCESSCPTLSGVAGRSAWDAFGSSASHGTGIGSASASPVGQQAGRRRCLVELTNTTARGVTATGRTRGRCVRSNGRGNAQRVVPRRSGLLDLWPRLVGRGWADGSSWSAAIVRNSVSSWARASGAIRESSWSSIDVTPSAVGGRSQRLFWQPSAGEGQIGARRQPTKTLIHGQAWAFGRIEAGLLALDDPAHLARRRRLSTPDAGLLDLWPRGADAVSRRGPPAARLDTAGDDPHARLVRLRRVHSGSRGRRLVVAESVTVDTSRPPARPGRPDPRRQQEPRGYRPTGRARRR
jgi:hypothetical protein